MSELSKNRKWIVYTGLILWSLMSLVVFNTIVLVNVLLRLMAFEYGTMWLPILTFLYSLSTIISIFIYMFYFPHTRVFRMFKFKICKFNERTRYMFPLILLTILYMVAWILNFRQSLLSIGDYINILYFTAIFSTTFTILLISISLYIYKERIKSFPL